MMPEEDRKHLQLILSQYTASHPATQLTSHFELILSLKHLLTSFANESSLELSYDKEQLKKIKPAIQRLQSAIHSLVSLLFFPHA